MKLLTDLFDLSRLAASYLQQPLSFGPVLLPNKWPFSRHVDAVRDNPESRDLTDSVVLVTGGNTGLGKETIVQLARDHRPRKIYLAARSEAKAKAAIAEIQHHLDQSGRPQVGSTRDDDDDDDDDTYSATRDTKKAKNIKGKSDNTEIVFVKLDLSSLSSVETAARSVLATADRLDVLILNAGVMATPSESKTEAGSELQLGTNHVGHFYLTRLLLPLLERTAGSVDGGDGGAADVASASSSATGSTASTSAPPAVSPTVSKSENALGSARIIVVSSEAYRLAPPPASVMSVIRASHLSPHSSQSTHPSESSCDENGNESGDRNAKDNENKNVSLSPFSLYGLSKASNILFAAELARRHPKVFSVSLHPGLIMTDLYLPTQRSNVFVKMSSGVMNRLVFDNVVQGAWNAVFLATTPFCPALSLSVTSAKAGDKNGNENERRQRRETIRFSNGGYYTPLGRLQQENPFVNDQIAAKELWEWTKREVELSTSTSISKVGLA